MVTQDYLLIIEGKLNSEKNLMGTNDSMQTKMRLTFNIPAILLNHLRYKKMQKICMTTSKRSTRHGKTDIKDIQPTSHFVV
jgi:hypothetical protein